MYAPPRETWIERLIGPWRDGPTPSTLMLRLSACLCVSVCTCVLCHSCNLVAGVSSLFAATLADRIGLILTMVGPPLGLFWWHD